jgi:hypothetical protein
LSLDEIKQQVVEDGKNGVGGYWNNYQKALRQKYPHLSKATIENELFDSYRKGIKLAEQELAASSARIAKVVSSDPGRRSGTQTPSKPRTTATPARRQPGRATLRQIAEDYLREHAIAGKTTCVFLDVFGNVVSSGYNGGVGAEGFTGDVKKWLPQTVVRNKGQATGFGGSACAEPHAWARWNFSKQARGLLPCYSLAFDGAGDYLKAACPSCKRQLAELHIEDLY